MMRHSGARLRNVVPAALLCATGCALMTHGAPALAGSAADTAAAASHLDALLRPSGIARVSLSPSGTRVAALIKGRDSDSDLMVLERRGDQVQTLMGTHLAGSEAIASYTWLTDDFLAVYFASPDEQFAQFAIADIDKRALEVQDPFTRLLKAAWGDSDHILLSETGGANCRTHAAARCLVSFDLAGATSVRVSDPLPLLPVAFLAVSPTEVYATGRDRRGMQQDLQLDASDGEWKPVARGTVAQRRRELQREQPVPEQLVRQAAQAGMPGAIPVWTEPDHQLVGLIGRAPQRAFVALDSRLDGLQALLEKQYPDARVQISGLNQALTRGMVQIDGPDQPPLYLFFSDAGGLTEYAQLEPTLAAATLGHTHVERGWADGMPVAVTLPPTGVTPIGVLVQPLIAPLAAAEQPLQRYDGLRQAFAQAGIIVVRALAPMPASFPSTAAGGAWREAGAARFRQVLAHVRSELAGGKPICLFGTGDDGALALAWSGAAPVDCTVAVGARLDPQAMTRPMQLLLPAPPGRVSRLSLSAGDRVSTQPAAGGTYTITPSNAQLHRELPALYGQPGSDELADPRQWVPQLPARVMLGYDMQLRVQQEYASESAAFRKALRRAGKNLTFDADEAIQSDDIQSRDRLLSAVVDYVRASLTDGTPAAH